MYRDIYDIPLEDVMIKYTGIKDRDITKEGKTSIVQCANPEHRDTNPSMKLYNKGDGYKYKCFACGVGGDIIDLVMLLGLEDTRDKAEQRVRKDFGLELPDKVELGVFCERKGIDFKFAIDQGWRNCSNGVLIPFKDQNGEIIAKKIRVKWYGKDKYYYVTEDGDAKYDSTAPYGIHWLPDYTKDTIYITEGETDAVTLRQSSFQSLGITSTNAWNSKFKELIKDFDKIIIVRDTDDAGMKLVNDIIRDFPENVFIKQVVGEKDINDYFVYECQSDVDVFKEKFPLLKDIPATPECFLKYIEQIDPRDIDNWAYVAPILENDIFKAEDFKEQVKTKTGLKIKVINEAISKYGKEKVSSVPNRDFYKKTKTGVKLIHSKYAEYLADTQHYCLISGTWFEYYKGVYKPIDDDIVRLMVSNNLIEEFRTKGNIEETMYFYEMQPKVRKSPEDFDTDPYVLNVQNGLLDIRTMVLREHSPDYLSILQLNVEYSPETADYSILEKFLNDKIPNKDNQLLAQEILGYAISSFNEAENWFLLRGRGRSGKGTFFNVIQHILGRDSVSNITLQNLNERFKTAELFGKLANIQGDLPSTPLKEGAVSTLKSVIGRDYLTVEKKGKDPFSFQSKATMLFGCNKVPQNTGDNSESSFWSKLIILPMDKTDTENVDPFFKTRLISGASLNAVFLWAIDGLKRLIDNKFVFTVTEESIQEKEAYKEISSNVIKFALEECEVGDWRDGYYCTKTELMRAYQEWCDIDGSSSKKYDNVEEELNNYFSLPPHNVTIDFNNVLFDNGNRVKRVRGIKLIDNNNTEY